MASGLLLLLVTGYLRRSRMPVSSQVKSLMLSVRVIYHGICSRTPVTWTHITLTPPLTQTTCTIKLPFSSELTSLFSHFYLVNSNSDNSNSSLTQTVAFFFWSKFTRSLEFWFLQQLSPMPTEISHWLQWTDHVWQSFPNLKSHTYIQNTVHIIIRMHNYVTVSVEISLICAALYTEMLKNQLLLIWKI